MKSASTLRTEVVNQMWNIAQDAKRSPQFHRYLEELILSDRKELLRDILEVAEKEDNYHDVIQAITNFKIK